MKNPLQLLGMLGTKTPEGMVIALIAAMAFGAIPVSYPLAGIAAGVVAIGGIMKYLDKHLEAKRYIEYKEGKNPHIKIGKLRGGHARLIILLAIAFICILIQGCLGNHPLLKPDSLAAALEVGTPYLNSECQEVAIYPGYELDFGDADSDNLVHGFGGIIGGCGRYGKISCYVIDDQVICKEIETLIAE